MATRVAGEAKGCIFEWKIENISLNWWLTKGKAIVTVGSFIADAIEGTKWNLGLYPTGYKDESYLSLCLRREKDCFGPAVIQVSFQFAIVSNDGSILKEETSSKISFTKGKTFGFQRFEAREKIFTTEREVFLPEDTLTVQCRIWNTKEKPVESKVLYYRTAFKVDRKWFMWRIDKFSTLKSGARKNFKEKSIDLDLIFNNDFVYKLNIDIISFGKAILYISCDASIIDSEGEKELFGFTENFSGNLKKGILSPSMLFPKTLMESKSRYFPNDVLSLEFIFSTVERFDSIMTSAKLQNQPDVGRMESNNSTILSEALKSMYKDGSFSDTELRTATKSFPAHRNILSARSPVFKSMLSNDMREKNSGHIDITDFEDGTIHRMMLYMYTDYLENLQFESASELYKISDKFQILSLKSRCSTFLKEHLCSTNACEVLTLADLYSDDDLKSSVQDYILEQRKQIFCSQKWKDFMKTHVHLAADVMYKMISEE